MTESKTEKEMIHKEKTKEIREEAARTKRSKRPINERSDPQTTGLRAARDHLSPPENQDSYPRFPKANFDPNAKWKRSEKTLAQMMTQANDAFDAIRYWRKNLWKAPSGKVGKMLVQEQTFLLENWTKGSNMELIALSLNMIFLPLMLQRSGRNVKAQAVKTVINSRLEKWNSGNIKELVDEGQYLQDHLQNPQMQAKTNPSKVFARLMLQGKVKAALRVVSGSQGGVAQPSPEVLHKLKEKHPPAAPTDHSVILSGEFKKVPDSAWEKIDATSIRTLALNSKGAGGWSGLDMDDMRPFLCSKNYGKMSEALCEAVADLTKRL